MKSEQRSLATAFVAAITLWLTALPGRAQNDTVTIGAAEFQRMVYSGHVLTQFSEKPELDASLQVLLELQRRNSHADPAGLADVSRQALQRYRANAPAYIRTIGSRDEILSAYLDALRQVPARTNFVPATLSLLNHFMLTPDDYTNASPAELIHSGNQRLLASEGEAGRQQTLVDTCTDRAGSNGTFAQAMDGLLLPEILVSLAHTPAAIIGNTNSALHGNPTMQALLALSAGSSDGSLTVSSNQLITLFTNETRTLWDTIHTNLALQVEINQSQPDLLTYLTNQPAIEANVQRTAAVREGQARTIAAATTAILIQSKLMEAKPNQPGFLPKLPKEMQETVDGLSKIAGGISSLTGENPLSVAGGAEGVLNILAGGLSIYNTFSGGSGESPDETIVREIGNVKTLIQDLSENVNYRFDRVDQSLTTIFNTLNDGFNQIEIRLDAQGKQTAILSGNVDQIRGALVDVQTDLHRLERHLQSYITELDARQLKATLNSYLGYEATFDLAMRYQDDYIPAETAFFTHARNNAVDGLSSRYLDRDYSAAGLFKELTESTGGSVSNRLDQNLSYIKDYLARAPLFQPTAGTLPMANPRDWFVGAYAYLQLAVENPRYFRQVNPSVRLDLITARGRELMDFFRSLTFNGTNINLQLYGELLNYYSPKLTSFHNQVQATEQQYATDNGFALDTWRQWDIAVPRVTATATEVLTAPEALPPIPREAATRIAAGIGHSLALKTDGTVVGWGDNAYGQIAIPSGLTNLLEIAAGGYHNLALKADGTVAGWGRNDSGQTAIPASATNVVAIAAGEYHSVARKADGTVVGWGDNTLGQTNSPASATNVVAIAAGAYHSLALKADGTVVGWGDNVLGQTTIPASATNVVAIAGGYSYSLALKTNGTVVAWGDNGHGQTRIPAGLTNVIAIEAGYYYGLALKADGTVVAWGDNGFRQCVVLPALTWRGAIATGVDHILVLKTDGTIVGWGLNTEGQITIPASATNVVAIAAREYYSLALKADGTVVGWGYNDAGQTTIPTSATNVVAISAGSSHSLALKADGKVLGWGYNCQGQTTIPASATNVVAIAAGEVHSLALKADGKVVAWGNNAQGQTTIPASATNVVAIAAGAYHNLALKADGKVVAWGDNGYGQTTIPASATNVVAIAAGRFFNLAFKADGKVVAWGDNGQGQTTIPAGLTNVEVIAAGSFHSLALKADGTVVTWGTIFYGMLVIPAGLTNVEAIAAGDYHGLALKADGTVVGWGRNDDGEINVPASATNVVAIAAGAYHTLALKADGKVLGWGYNDQGQTTIPASATNVVAIAAGSSHSLALKADGTVVTWGANSLGQTTIPARVTNVVAIAASAGYSLFLNGRSISNDGQNLSFVQGHIPVRVGDLLRGVDGQVLTNLGLVGPLNSAGTELSGAKALLQAVLELGMPYTMERDDVLHGFFYGTEALADLDVSRSLREAEIAKLQANPNAKPQAFAEVAQLRYQRCAERLNARLTDLAATGQPEIPRLVGQTVRLLNLLRDSWGTVPPTALEIGRKTNGLGLVLYGEPYACYTLQQSFNLTGWANTSITNLRSADSPIGIVTTNLPITGDPGHYYRAAQPVP